MYDGIKKRKRVRAAARSHVILVLGQNESEEASATDGVQDNKYDEPQNNLQGRDLINVLSRLSTLENDNIKLFKKLDDIAAAIHAINDVNIAF